jgi:hypothetical protein
MSKSVVKKLSPNRKLKVVKKLTSGMWETNTGERVPPYADVKIGDVIDVVDGKFEFPENKVQGIEPVDPLQVENEELKQRIERLEKIVGAKASETKSDKAATDEK